MGRARDFAARGEQGRSALVLDASAVDTDVHENILLDGTDAASKNAGSISCKRIFLQTFL